MAYTYASDVNANNLATQRGQATIGGLTQIARVAAAGTAGAFGWIRCSPSTSHRTYLPCEEQRSRWDVSGGNGAPHRLSHA